MRALAAKWQNEDKKEGNTRNCQWPCTTYLIFVTYTTNISEEKFVMWRNFRFLNVTDVDKSEVSPHAEQFQISLHDKGNQCSPNIPQKDRHPCSLVMEFLHHHQQCILYIYVSAGSWARRPTLGRKDTATTAISGESLPVLRFYKKKS